MTPPYMVPAEVEAFSSLTVLPMKLVSVTTVSGAFASIQ